MQGTRPPNISPLHSTAAAALASQMGPDGRPIGREAAAAKLQRAIDRSGAAAASPAGAPTLGESRGLTESAAAVVAASRGRSVSTHRARPRRNPPSRRSKTPGIPRAQNGPANIATDSSPPIAAPTPAKGARAAFWRNLNPFSKRPKDSAVPPASEETKDQVESTINRTARPEAALAEHRGQMPAATIQAWNQPGVAGEGQSSTFEGRNPSHAGAIGREVSRTIDRRAILGSTGAQEFKVTTESPPSPAPSRQRRTERGTRAPATPAAAESGAGSGPGLRPSPPGPRARARTDGGHGRGYIAPHAAIVRQAQRASGRSTKERACDICLTAIAGGVIATLTLGGAAATAVYFRPDLLRREETPASMPITNGTVVQIFQMALANPEVRGELARLAANGTSATEVAAILEKDPRLMSDLRSWIALMLPSAIEEDTHDITKNFTTNMTHILEQMQAQLAEAQQTNGLLSTLFQNVSSEALKFLQALAGIELEARASLNVTQDHEAQAGESLSRTLTTELKAEAAANASVAAQDKAQDAATAAEGAATEAKNALGQARTDASAISQLRTNATAEAVEAKSAADASVDAHARSEGAASLAELNANRSLALVASIEQMVGQAEVNGAAIESLLNQVASLNFTVGTAIVNATTGAVTITLPLDINGQKELVSFTPGSSSSPTPLPPPVKPPLLMGDCAPVNLFSTATILKVFGDSSTGGSCSTALTVSGGAPTSWKIAVLKDGVINGAPQNLNLNSVKTLSSLTDMGCASNGEVFPMSDTSGNTFNLSTYTCTLPAGSDMQTAIQTLLRNFQVQRATSTATSINVPGAVVILANNGGEATFSRLVKLISNVGLDLRGSVPQSALSSYPLLGVEQFHKLAQGLAGATVTTLMHKLADTTRKPEALALPAASTESYSTTLSSTSFAAVSAFNPLMLLTAIAAISGVALLYLLARSLLNQKPFELPSNSQTQGTSTVFKHSAEAKGKCADIERGISNH